MTTVSSRLESSAAESYLLNRFSVHGLKSIIFMYPCCDDRRNRGTLQNETKQPFSTILNTNKTVIARHANTRNELWPQNSAARCPCRPAPSAAALCSALPLSPGPIGSYYSFGASPFARPHRQLLFVRRRPSRPAPSAAVLCSALPLSPRPIGSCSLFGASPFARPLRQLLFVRRRLSRPALSAAAIASAPPLSLGPIGSCSCFRAPSLARPDRQLLFVRVALSPRPIGRQLFLL